MQIVLFLGYRLISFVAIPKLDKISLNRSNDLEVYVRGNCCLVLFEACLLLALAGGT